MAIVDTGKRAADGGVEASRSAKSTSDSVHGIFFQILCLPTHSQHLDPTEFDMADLQENLIDWLRDAHAMEQQAEQMLKAQAARIEHYPKVKARIEEHLQETLGQQKLLVGCIERLGGTPSGMKDVMGKVMAFGQAAGGALNSDEIIKGAIASYVFENLEIATYTALIAAARTVGDVETVRVCEQILPQEVAMAKWVLGNLPELTEEFLVRDAAPDVEAKR
jgi:ferritin-like metal-binding protein YciE